MASNKLCRRKKIVALCAINETNTDRCVINTGHRSRGKTKSGENDYDTNMLFSNDYGMEILSSPIRPVRVYETSSSNRLNEVNGLNAETLTDISFNSLQNTVNTSNSGGDQSYLINATKESNLSVPTAWLEQNSLSNPTLNSILLDNNHSGIDCESETAGTNREVETIVNPLVENNQASCSVKNILENANVEENVTYILNHETGTFDKICTSVLLTTDEITDPLLLSSQIRENRQLRLLGQTYKGTKRLRDPSSSRAYSTDVVKKNRKMSDKPWTHGSEQKSDRSFVCAAITEESRSDIFKYFWQLPSWDAKKSYINGLVQIRNTLKRRPTSNTTEENNTSKKMYGFDCYLPNQTGAKIRVCKSLFLATLDLNKDVFQEWVRTTNFIDPPTPSKVRKIDRIVSISTPKVLKSRSVDLWLEQVPVVPSHYCRGDSSRTYVEDTFHSKTHMHNVYKQWCKENNLNAVTRKLFIEKLEENKISIFKPRKDQCDTCVSYKEGNVSQETYDIHIIKKNEAREAKEKATNEASSTVLVVTMDMQSVLLCPKLFVSEQYYKQKLAMHNYTFYVKNDKNVHLYVWHEGEGGVTANNITSCILHFLKEHCTTYKKVFLISDGCCSQNRNKVLRSALSNFSAYLGIEIEQLILEKGHTMMEVDSVHSTLERQFKSPIYAPTDYISRMRQARPTQPYIINYLDHTFFNNYETLPGNFVSIRPGKCTGDPTVTDIRSLLYKDGVVQYKLRHTDTFKLLPQRKPENRESIEPVPLYDTCPKIDPSKYAALQSLKSYMHKDYHPFYDSLNV